MRTCMRGISSSYQRDAVSETRDAHLSQPERGGPMTKAKKAPKKAAKAPVPEFHTRDERLIAGKALRETVPRERHARAQPGVRRERFRETLPAPSGRSAPGALPRRREGRGDEIPRRHRGLSPLAARRSRRAVRSLPAEGFHRETSSASAASARAAWSPCSSPGRPSAPAAIQGGMPFGARTLCGQERPPESAPTGRRGATADADLQRHFPGLDRGAARLPFLRAAVAGHEIFHSAGGSDGRGQHAGGGRSVRRTKVWLTDKTCTERA